MYHSKARAWTDLNSLTVPAPPQKTLSGGAIAGIVIGTIAGLALIVVGVLFARQRKMRDRGDQDGAHTGIMLALDPFPMNAPSSATQPDMSLPAGYTLKNRHGYGPARLIPSSSSDQLTRRSAADHSVQPPTTDSYDEPETPVQANETSVTRLIQHILSVMQTQEAPPAYAGHQTPQAS